MGEDRTHEGKNCPAADYTRDSSLGQHDDVFCKLYNRGVVCPFGARCRYKHGCYICGNPNHGASDHANERKNDKDEVHYACSHLSVDRILTDAINYSLYRELESILTEGANIRYSGSRSIRHTAIKYGVRDEHRQLVRSKLDDDVQKRYRIVLSESQERDLKYVWYHPIGVVFKKSYGKDTDKPRLVDDCSAQGLNDQIDIPETSLNCWNNLICFIQTHPGTLFIGKSDIKSAYKLVAVRKADRPLLCTRFNGKTYMSLRLPFGLRSSSYLWGVVAGALLYVVRQRCMEQLVSDFFIDVYVDDFIFVVTKARDASRMMDIFLSVASAWKIPVSLDKTFNLTINPLEVLGVMIDPAHRTLSIPAKRMINLKNEIRSIGTASISRRSLQSLIGHLVWL